MPQMERWTLRPTVYTQGSAHRSPQHSWTPHRPDGLQPTTTTRRAAAVDCSPPPGSVPHPHSPRRVGASPTPTVDPPRGRANSGGAGPRPDASRLRGGPSCVGGLATAAVPNCWVRHPADRPVDGWARCAVRRFRDVGAACLRVCGEHSGRGHANGVSVVISRVGSRHRLGPPCRASRLWVVAVLAALVASLVAAVVGCGGGCPGRGRVR